MKIAYCEDEKIQKEILEESLGRWGKTDLVWYESAEQMLFECDGRYPSDLIILDIQMKKQNGMELARRIRQTDAQVPILFLTAMKEYVFEGYEVQAVRYLLKPMQQEKVFELLDLARQNLQEQPSLILNCADEKKKLYLSQIAAIEAQGHYLIFHTTAGQLQQKASLSSLAGHLGDSFVMSHRSFYVNLAHLLRISRTECTLDTGLTVPVSRGAYKNLNEQFIRYYRKEMLE